MSHISCNEKEISYYLDLLRTNHCNIDIIAEILNGIIPKSDKAKIDIDISDAYGHAYFDSKLEMIHINEELLDEYVKKYCFDMIKVNTKLSECVDDLYAYNFMYALIHEVEHVYQFMFSQGHLNAPYNIVGELYHKLFEYDVDNMNCVIRDILLFKKMFYSRKVNFVLERNANIETCDLLRRVCEYENNKDIFGSINCEYLIYMKLGYLRKKYNGSFDESFSKIWRRDLFDGKVCEDISIDERIRYGLPIDDESRRLLLRLE